MEAPIDLGVTERLNSPGNWVGVCQLNTWTDPFTEILCCFREYKVIEEVQKSINPKCNIALSSLCKTDNLNCLLGWAEEFQTLQTQYQEAGMRLMELQNKYQAAKKTALWHYLWADGKEQHIQQEWQRIVFSLQNV